MELSSLTLLVTEQCNFNCSYCYQKRGESALAFKAISKFIDFSFPQLSQGGFINFSGGEPLLAFDMIIQTVKYVHKISVQHEKAVNFSITTNGWLLDKDILDFLERHKFSVMLSYDGLQHDSLCHQGSTQSIKALLPQLLSSSIRELSINSVYSPDTCGQLSQSVVYMLEAGIKNIRLAFSFLEPWSSAQLLHLKNELANLREFLSSHYDEYGTVPVENFRQSNKGIFTCSAGRDRLALASDGKIWGCYLFSDYFKDKEDSRWYSDYCFGDSEEFPDKSETLSPEIRSNYDRISHRYSSLNFRKCIGCPSGISCVICPMVIAFSNGFEGEIPSWMCDVTKTLAEEKEKLWQRLAGS